MPPWPDVNADLVCVEHGSLARNGQLRAKRRTVEKRVWKQLCVYFPGGSTFRVDDGECIQCTVGAASAKEAAQRLKESRSEEIANPLLRALFSRKTGVSSSVMMPPPPAAGAAGAAVAGGGGAAVAPGDVAAVAAGALTGGGRPLLPGIYHLMPRCWLTSWRNYVRDPAVPRPRLPEPSVLLCEGHGLLLTPPHVEEYLFGERRNLLAGSLNPERSGCVCEVLTPEEWEALTLLYPCDLCVRFCVHPGGGEIAWNLERCRVCDPCYIGEVFVKQTGRKLTF
ncbi:unnamed protein product [Phaeothamnion confervicola]